MGLDQFAYAINSDGEKRELAYWRKHPNLQGWMERLWESKGRPNAHEDSNDFNCIPVELTEEDLDNLEQSLETNSLPETTGFFFGENKDNMYRQQDVEFIQVARQALDEGDKVVYDSWW
ncbi:phosphoglycerate kinase [bacterium]|nr:phosphoglycerate kinase [bacterium]NDG31905.1 phosphoglycerate kinase [bacterium]